MGLCRTKCNIIWRVLNIYIYIYRERERERVREREKEWERERERISTEDEIGIIKKENI